MKIEYLYTVISIAIFTVVFYLFYKVLSPFLVPIAWAMVLSITFYPVYILFEKLLNGETLVEAYYQSKPYNSWQMILIGDPLYTPFKK